MSGRITSPEHGPEWAQCILHRGSTVTRFIGSLTVFSEATRWLDWNRLVSDAETRVASLIPRHAETLLTSVNPMLRLLECIATVEQWLVLVAPPHATIPPVFKRLTVDSFRHQRLVKEMQAMRGGTYLHGGHLTREQLSAEGLHQTPKTKKAGIS